VPGGVPGSARRRVLARGLSADRGENLPPGSPDVLVHRAPRLLGIARGDGLDNGIVPVARSLLQHRVLLRIMHHEQRTARVLNFLAAAATLR
jgi:hypothetical protein